MPVDFDQIWKRAGYEHRHHAVRAFESCIIEDVNRSGEAIHGGGTDT